MKYILILIFVASCAGTGSKTTMAPNAVKADYLQRFNDLNSKLQTQRKICLDESKTVLVKPIIERNIDEKQVQFQFINEKVKKQAFKRYDPTKFDWALKAKIKNLYLDYPYDEAISQKHFEVSNSLNDCANDFDHLNFLKALMNDWEKNRQSSSEYKTILRKYFTYIKENQVPPLTTLILDHVVQSLNEKELIRLPNPEKYQEESRKIELLYTSVGRSILLDFKDKNYDDIYDSDKKLVSELNDFKDFIFQQIQI